MFHALADIWRVFIFSTAEYQTTIAAVVFSANGLPSSVKLNRPGKSWAALALEAQALPDAPHHPEFGDITLRPLAPVHHQIRYEIKY